MPKTEQLIIPTPPTTGMAFAGRIEQPIDIARNNDEHLPSITKIVGAGKEYAPYIDKQTGLLEYQVVGDAPYAPSKYGWYVYHEGMKHPQRGFPYPHAVRACEIVKRVFLAWTGFFVDKNLLFPFIGFAILPRKIKVKIIENWIYWYMQIADVQLLRHYLEYDYYTDICRELKPFVTTFLMELGVSMESASRFSYAFITLIEYDTAYRFRIQDILSETTKEKLIADPVGEMRRLVGIMAERDNRKHLIKKFERFVTVMRFGSWFLKKPFQRAMENVDFPKMQFDEIDRFAVQHWTGYNWFGETIEERVKKYERATGPIYKIK